MTVMGGIPSDFLIPHMTSEADFEGYLDYLFKAVAPGKRIIFGVADNVPPSADFNRLIRLEERVRNECRLPLKKSSFTPFRQEKSGAQSQESWNLHRSCPDQLLRVRQALLKGDGPGVSEAAQAALAAGIEAEEILQKGLIAAMEVIGVKFKNDEMFMPEVLLCARAMNAGLATLAASHDGRPTGNGRQGGYRDGVMGTCTTSAKTWSPLCSKVSVTRWWTLGSMSVPRRLSPPLTPIGRMSSPCRPF